MKDIEKILGYFAYEMSGKQSGKWNISKDKESFVRFFDNGFRQLINKREHTDEFGYTSEKYFVSLGYEKQFSRGEEPLDSLKEAQRWADAEDFEAYMLFEDEAESLRNRHDKTKEPYVPKGNQEDTFDYGF